jgi:hypothetical protein
LDRKYLIYPKIKNFLSALLYSKYIQAAGKQSWKKLNDPLKKAIIETDPL